MNTNEIENTVNMTSTADEQVNEITYQQVNENTDETS